MFQTNNEVNEAQEVMAVYNHVTPIDIESETASPANAEIEVMEEDKNDPTTNAADDRAIASNKNKMSNYLTGRNVACGLTTLLVISAGVAAGSGIAGAAIKPDLQSQNNVVDTSWYPGDKSSKSGKSCKASSSGNGGDFYECIVEPVVGLAYAVTTFNCDDPGEPISEYDFFKEVWKPYTKQCNCFWGKVFYLLYIVARFVIEYICRIIWWASTRAGAAVLGDGAGQMSNVVASFSGMTMSMPESCEWMMGVSVGDFQVQDMDLTLATSMMGDVRVCGVDMWAAMKVAAADMMNANINVATIGDTSTLDLDQVVVLSDITDAVEMVAYAVEEAVIAFVSVVNEAEAAAAEMQDGGV